MIKYANKYQYYSLRFNILFFYRPSYDNGIIKCVWETLANLSLVFYLFNQFYFVSGDPNGWKLSRIEEVDHETPV